ncbi:ATP-binding cassette domain-containing protein [Dyella flagellata]|uniref:ABC transporter ATP-binding protein n=1 Tax=Dyella flagellata TaxID=1867833 RepID=A0ABQ5X9P8_9GAMM|nr:ABC transporter ATP-binding protein [Dyella flagellata]GLQ87901.1 ABC transporter ATP-binding protein [Dyella flagellata]
MSQPGQRTRLPLSPFFATLKGIDRAETMAYVLLSLACALAGSAAAVLLIPLVQPHHPLVLGGKAIDLHGGIESHAILFAAITAVFAFLRWQAARLAAHLASRYGMNLRGAVHARLIDASLPSLADASSAEIAQVLTYNIEIVTQGFSALLQLLVAGITAVVSLGLALWISPPLALGAPLLGVLALAASRINGREQAKISRQYVLDLTGLFWHSEDFPRRLRHVRSFEREDAEKASYGEISAKLSKGYRHQLDLIATGRLTLELLAAAGVAAMFVLADRLHGVDQASLIAVGLLLGRLLPYLVSTRQSLQQLHSAVPAFQLWQRYMRLDPARPQKVALHGVQVNGSLHIEHVQLAAPLVALGIRDLSLRAGTLTLICGNSGIGKTSLVDVLAGMMPPGVFSARIGQRRLGFDDYCELVRHGAYISQSVRPWQHSVRECLLWAAPDADEESLQRALADVGLDQRLADSQHGLDTALSSSSSRLSGGELQRLLLAQVILRQPLLALLDEATSALDVAAEVAVLSALKRRLPRTILLVVSHRSSVAAIADQCLTIGADFITTVHACEQVYA